MKENLAQGPALSVVIPIYNEAPFLEEAVGAIVAEMREKVSESFEVVLVENGSRDDTEFGLIADRLQQFDLVAIRDGTISAQYGRLCATAPEQA